jgi:hypothetical protein
MLTEKIPAVFPAAHDNAPAMMSHGPLLLVSVNPDPAHIQFRFTRWLVRRNRVNRDIPEVAAVYVAHVPVVYHVPALIRHPLLAPPVYACKNPFPR